MLLEKIISIKTILTRQGEMPTTLIGKAEAWDI